MYQEVGGIIMNYKEIMELTMWLEKSAFTQYSLSMGGVHISMSKQQMGHYEIAAQGPPVYQMPPMPTAAPPATESLPQPAAQQPETPKTQATGHVIVSPIVGTYYESASPDKPALVKVGQPVKKGDVLCILEAMKIMNEITADVDGVIAEILVENGEMVEARQPLFRIEN
jgi:acetyl-CoA carboxylase biotin carboxyl carrier protein